MLPGHLDNQILQPLLNLNMIDDWLVGWFIGWFALYLSNVLCGQLDSSAWAWVFGLKSPLSDHRFSRIPKLYSEPSLF